MQKKKKLQYNIMAIKFEKCRQSIKKTQGKVTICETNALDLGITRLHALIQKVIGD